MALPTIRDLVEEGLDRLIYQWRNSPNVIGLLTSYLEQLQVVEDMHFQLLDERGLSTAIGEQLDILGKIIGETRQGRSDSDYRIALQNRVLINNADGSTENVISTMKTVSGATTVPMWEHFPASYHIFLDTGMTPSVGAMVESITSAGVNGRVMFDDGGISFIAPELQVILENLQEDTPQDIQANDGFGGLQDIQVSSIDPSPSQTALGWFPELGELTIINPLCELYQLELQ